MASLLFKMIIVGDSRVGKSALLLQFTDRRFRQEYDLTIGVEFGSKVVDINDTQVKLQVWDTAGQEQFRSITRSYYRGTSGIIIMYDVSSRASFEHIGQWYEECKQNSSSTVTMLLVGNKCDLPREVSTEEGQKLAQDLGVGFMEISSRNPEEVDRVFEYLTRIIAEKVRTGEIDPAADNSGVRCLGN